MGIGIVIIFWIIVLIFISLILVPFIKKNGFLNTFLQIFTTLVAFFVIFTITSKVGQKYIGKEVGSFGDSGYIEVKNGYRLQWIDTKNNAILTDGEKDIALNIKSFSESFKFFIHNDLIIIKKLTNPDELLIVDTVKRIQEVTSEKWLVQNNILKQPFMTPHDYFEKESEKLENLLPVFLAFLIALFSTYIFNKKYYKNKETK